MTLPKTMRAMAINGYGGPEVIVLQEVPVPALGPDEVLVKVAVAGVGVWDAMEREGLMAGLMSEEAKKFPRVLGADGAGTIAAVGDNVYDFSVGEAVYAFAFANPKGGAYAEYVAVPATQIALIPPDLTMDEAGALAVPGVTALRGLDDALKLQSGQALLVFGASGGVGQPAVQLAKGMGAHVIAVVSTPEGAAVARAGGADVVVNSRTEDLAAALKTFAPDGLDAVLTVVNAPGLDVAIAAVRAGGRVAYPHGVQPEPQVQAGVTAIGFDGEAGREVLDRLNDLIVSHPFTVHIDKRFPLADAAKAHAALKDHHLGRMVLTVA
jgi:NADPH2:quinone reductase